MNESVNHTPQGKHYIRLLFEPTFLLFSLLSGYFKAAFTFIHKEILNLGNKNSGNEPTVYHPQRQGLALSIIPSA